MINKLLSACFISVLCTSCMTAQQHRQEGGSTIQKGNDQVARRVAREFKAPPFTRADVEALSARHNEPDWLREARRKAHWSLEQAGVARMEDIGVPRSRVAELLG